MEPSFTKIKLGQGGGECGFYYLKHGSRTQITVSTLGILKNEQTEVLTVLEFSHFVITGYVHFTVNP